MKENINGSCNFLKDDGGGGVQEQGRGQLIVILLRTVNVNLCVKCVAPTEFTHKSA